MGTSRFEGAAQAADVATLQSDVATLQSDVTNLQSDVTNLQGFISDFDAVTGSDPALPTGTPTTFTFGTNLYIGGFHRFGDAPTTQAIPGAGRYRVDMYVQFGAAAGGSRRLTLALGGGAVPYGNLSVSSDSGGSALVTELSHSVVVDFDGIAAASMQVLHTAGTDLVVSGWMAVQRMA